MSEKKCVLAISGLDPCGGAGLKADIETISHLNCHVAPIISSIVIQDTINVKNIQHIEPDIVYQQVKTVLNDIPIHTIKIGLLCHEEMVNCIHQILQEYPALPVIYDPIIKAGGGYCFVNNETLFALKKYILPNTTLLVPNSEEAKLLTGKNNLSACAKEILNTGCENILITGTHEATTNVTNIFFTKKEEEVYFEFERLPQQFRGTGCVLASAISALIATNKSLLEAVTIAQDYVYSCIKRGIKLGRGQHILKH